MLFSQIIGLLYTYTKYINTLHRQQVKAGGTYSNHSALRYDEDGYYYY
jgi:hypothetical protein